MSSLFQGFTNDDGRVRSTTLDPGVNSIIYRGIAIDAVDNVVHVSIGAVIAAHVGGVPVANNGVVCIHDAVATPEDQVGGGLVAVGGRLYCTSVDVPSLIHQGVGLRAGGRLCRIAV